jgi:hypothetical protein
VRDLSLIGTCWRTWFWLGGDGLLRVEGIQTSAVTGKPYRARCVNQGTR